MMMMNGWRDVGMAVSFIFVNVSTVLRPKKQQLTLTKQSLFAQSHTWWVYQSNCSFYRRTVLLKSSATSCDRLTTVWTSAYDVIDNSCSALTRSVVPPSCLTMS